MRSSPDKHENELPVITLIQKEPVRSYVAFADACEFSLEFMVMALGFQSFPCCKRIDDLFEFSHIEARFPESPEVFAELLRREALVPLHFPSISRNISCVEA